MRGKLSGDTAKASPDGITPAHAGKTAAANFIAKAQEDHPRACGENDIPAVPLCSVSGSPPRMRGKRMC